MYLKLIIKIQDVLTNNIKSCEEKLWDKEVFCCQQQDLSKWLLVKRRKRMNLNKKQNYLQAVRKCMKKKKKSDKINILVKFLKYTCLENCSNSKVLESLYLSKTPRNT